MPKFRKKLVEVDAEQFFVNKKPWPEGVRVSKVRTRKDSYFIVTVNGWADVKNKDWIFIDIDGWIDVIGPDIFEQDYEAVIYGDCQSSHESQSISNRFNILDIR